MPELARTGVPALLAEVRRLQERRTQRTAQEGGPHPPDAGSDTATSLLRLGFR